VPDGVPVRNATSATHSPLLLLVSEMRNERPKVFYGWWVALTAALGLFLNTATIVVFSFGFFAKAIGQEFHVGRGKISLAFTMHNLTAALFIPLAGRLVDRYGARRVLLPFTCPARFDSSFQPALVTGDMATLRLLRCLGRPLWWGRGDAIHGRSLALV
jgi:MFS family permease